MKLVSGFLLVAPAFAQSAASEEAGGGFFLILLIIGVVAFLVLRGKRGDAEKAERARLIQNRPPTAVIRYRGRYERATQSFQRDAANLATLGYYPTNQSWVPGEWRTWQYLLALLLCIVVVGVGIFLYMLVVRPPGTLAVTYSSTR